MVSSAMGIWHLKHRLRIAIACLPLAGAGLAGCSEKRSARPLPTCPGGEFCAPLADLAEFKQDGSVDQLGCPTAFDRARVQRDDGGSELQRGDQHYFDETATRSKRKTDVSACCYRWVASCPGGRPALDRGLAVRAAAVAVRPHMRPTWCGA